MTDTQQSSVTPLPGHLGPEDLLLVADPDPAATHLAWVVDRMTNVRPPMTAAEAAEHFAFDEAPWIGIAPADFARRAPSGLVRRILERSTEPDGSVVLLGDCVDGHQRRFVFGFAADGRVRVRNPERVIDGDIAVAVYPRDELDTATLRGIDDVYRTAYVDPDPDYLAQSLCRATHIAVARAGPDVVGFLTGGTADLEVEDLGTFFTWTPGLACVSPEVRRKGLFQALGGALAAAALPRAPQLAGVKVAHPASARGPRQGPTAMPRRGVTPNAVHRAVGAAVARALGASDFDADHFVCKGNGRPMRAVVEVEASQEEWEAFEHVNRENGDSLLIVNWVGTPPEGW